MVVPRVTIDCPLGGQAVDIGGNRIDLSRVRRVSKRQDYVRLGIPDLLNGKTYRPFIYGASLQNEYVSALYRVCRRVPTPSKAGMRQLRKMGRQFSKLLPTVLSTWDIEEILRHMDAKQRRRYRQAYEWYLERGLSKRDAIISAFVKGDPRKSPYADGDPWGSGDPGFHFRATGLYYGNTKVKAPRMIQFRTFVFGVIFASYIKPIERALYHVRGYKYFPRTRFIAKGLCAKRRARLLRKKWDTFDKPVCYTIDGSKFDLHVAKELLQLEHSVYLRLFGNDPLLRTMCNWQLTNKAKTTHGIRYTVNGGRMSGDMNTALGNCVLMSIMVASYFAKVFPGRRFDFLDDGDDCVVMFESDMATTFEETVVSEFLHYGMELTVDPPKTIFERIEFCQCRPVEVSGEWMMIRNPYRVLSRAACGRKLKLNPAQRIFLIGQCELIMHSGVPVLQAWAMALMRAGVQSKMVLDRQDAYYWHLRDAGLSLDSPGGPTEVDNRTRESFALSWEISVDEQLRLEARLHSLSVPVELEVLPSDFVFGAGFLYAKGAEHL